MSQSSHDRNLLLGILALQMDFVGRDQLVAAMNAWVLEKDRALADVLLEQNAITAEERSLLSGLVEQRIKRNEGDVQASLAGAAPASEMKDLLTHVRDDGIAATLVQVSGTASGVARPESATGVALGRSSMKQPSDAPSEDSGRASSNPDGALRYESLKPHARGGLGQIWLARDKQLSREVALKELLSHHADNGASRARFMQEAEITGRLEHPGIVPIYSLGAYADGRPYYAMRFIHGKNLQDALREFHGLPSDHNAPTRRGHSWVDLDQHRSAAPAADRKAATRADGATVAADDARAAAAKSAGFELKPHRGEAVAPTRGEGASRPAKLKFQSVEFRKLLERFLDVCNAIEYAHSRGVVHRDIKPSNIMLGKYGETLVVDWGLAKAIGRDERHEDSAEQTLVPSSGGSSAGTQMGTAIGTPAYMSPEQAAGELHRAGPPSDVYSLGATLYELLTGQGPFSGSDVKTVLERVKRGDFPRPREVQKLVPPPLEAVCLKAMALKPEDRYPSADALAEDVRHWMADDPVAAHDETLPQRIGRWMRRHKTWVKAGVAMLVLWIVIASSAAVRINASREAAEDDKQRAEKAADSLAQSLYFTRIATADKELAAKNAGQAADMLEQCPPELRAFEWKLLMRRLQLFERDGALEAPRQLAGHTRAVNELAYNAQGTLLASGSVDGTIRVWDPESGEEHEPRRHSDLIVFPVTALAFSPNGTTLASGAAKFNVDANARKMVMERLQDADVDFAEMLRDERIWKGVAELVQGKAGVKQFGGLMRGQAWDTVAALFGTREGRQTIAKLSEGDTAELVSEVVGTGWDLLPEGVSGEILIWDLADKSGRRHVRELRGHTSQVAALAFTADGRKLISISWGSSHHPSELIVWDAATGDRLDYVSDRNQQLGAVAVDPKGALAAIGLIDGSVILRDLETKTNVRTIAAHSGPVLNLAFDPRRDVLASTSMDGTARLWDVKTGEPLLEPLRGHVGPVFGVCFHPSQERLVTAGWDKSVRVWDTRTGRETLSLPGHGDSVLCALFSPQGDAIASAGGGLDTAIRLWSAASPDEETASDAAANLNWHEAAVQCVRFSPDGTCLATTGMDQKVVVADAETFAKRFTLQPPDDHRQIVKDLAFSPNGQWLATASWDRTARIVDAKTGELVRKLEGSIGPVNCVAFRPQGDLLASGSGTGGVRLWDVQTGEEHIQLAGHNFVVTDVAFSPDGKLLASCGHDNLVKIWDVASGRHLRTLIGHDDIVWQVAFAGSDTIITASNDRTVRVWNAATGVETRTFRKHKDHVMALATHPDPALAHVVASGSEDGVVMLWDLRNGRELAPRRQVAGVILSLDFDPAGKRLAVGGGYSDRGEVRVWEVELK